GHEPVRLSLDQPAPPCGQRRPLPPDRVPTPWLLRVFRRTRRSHRRAHGGLAVCLAPLARRVGGVAHRAARRALRLLLPADDPGLSGCVPGGGSAATLAPDGLVRRLRAGYGLEIDRDGGAGPLSPARHLSAAPPACLADAVVRRGGPPGVAGEAALRGLRGGG